MKYDPRITHSFLREYLHYNPATGDLTWIKRLGGQGTKGRRAGSRMQPGIRRKETRGIRLLKRVYLLHRVIWFWMTGSWPTFEIDHKDGDGLNNRWANLREATRQQNEVNKGAYKTNKSGLKGVATVRTKSIRSKYRDGLFYIASIMRNRKKVIIGRFHTPKEAHAAYVREASKFDGEFLRT